MQSTARGSIITGITGITGIDLMRLWKKLDQMIKYLITSEVK